MQILRFVYNRNFMSASIWFYAFENCRNIGMSSHAMIAGLAAYEMGKDAIAHCMFMLQLLHFLIANMPMDLRGATRLSSTMSWTSAIRALAVSRLHRHFSTQMSIPYDDRGNFGVRCESAPIFKI